MERQFLSCCRKQYLASSCHAHPNMFHACSATDISSAKACLMCNVLISLRFAVNLNSLLPVNCSYYMC